MQGILSRNRTRITSRLHPRVCSIALFANAGGDRRRGTISELSPTIHCSDSRQPEIESKGLRQTAGSTMAHRSATHFQMSLSDEVRPAYSCKSSSVNCHIKCDGLSPARTTYCRSERRCSITNSGRPSFAGIRESKTNRRRKFRRRSHSPRFEMLSRFCFRLIIPRHPHFSVFNVATAAFGLT